eukprot:2528523-Prymnesium_polylepis.1
MKPLMHPVMPTLLTCPYSMSGVVGPGDWFVLDASEDRGGLKYISSSRLRAARAGAAHSLPHGCPLVGVSNKFLDLEAFLVLELIATRPLVFAVREKMTQKAMASATASSTRKTMMSIFWRRPRGRVIRSERSPEGSAPPPPRCCEARSRKLVQGV